MIDRSQMAKNIYDPNDRVMLVSIGTQWLVFLPLAYLVGPFLGFGLLGVWILQGGSRALQSYLFTGMWRGRKWQQIDV